ncbi:small G protein signaling modulator 3 homolog isoform X3 [Nematostella vectensis]|uniref:small G protein signaling modulator 3 homolog isoform X3 n=1 Tax=Nematostella vectensis TaxID=45351 RepID=UPI002077780B|nr:small G protein signaling modulator 3 homolog isoform X3 [Nematostella vectensis]
MDLESLLWFRERKYFALIPPLLKFRGYGLDCEGKIRCGKCVQLYLTPTLSEDEDDEYEDNLAWDDSAIPVAGGSTPVNGSFYPAIGGPFSALTPSMWPQDILSRIQQTEDSGHRPEGQYDEFGFIMDGEDLEHEYKDPDPGNFVTNEDDSLRLKWTAYLEFTQNQDVGDMTWDKVSPSFPHSDKLRELVCSGIPHSMRAPIWMRISGALQKKINAEFTYKQVVRASSDENSPASKQIEKDLLRTMPNNACFSTPTSTGLLRMRRILRSLAWLYPDIGYCQGMGMIVASLLLFVEEEDAFWLTSTIIEDLNPPSYYSSTLIGVQADQRVLRQLIVSYLPHTDQQLKEHDIELSLITLHWFLTAFASVVHTKILLRIWDIYFYEGSVTLFRATLGMLKLKEEYILTLDNSAQIFNVLSDIPGDITDADVLIQAAQKASASLTEVILDAHRKKHMAFLMADLGVVVDKETGKHITKHQQVQRRQLGSNRSFFNLIFGKSNFSLEKAKNIKQTEFVADLREAIMHIARHFDAIDPKKGLEVDYSLEGHTRDHERFINVARNRRRRAKALLDFERHDDDELGFRKNDIITIISQKDEHCWVGELNGLRGWFPAKFVQILDERSKEYSTAGDDSVSETVTDLVRGGLCPALKNIFEHGMRRPSILGGPCHPWLFIEEASQREVERDFQSVYSRLVLCKTFRLDEDGKVLSPEEILYRAVQSINMSHDAASAQMDVKFRSLVCYGLNEQCLHLWLESLCACEDTVAKWYHPWSFLRSPGWIQIKCELRVLATFAFNLNVEWELVHTSKVVEALKEDKSLQVSTKEVTQPMKDGVRDMLVKHHLFSWDL